MFTEQQGGGQQGPGDLCGHFTGAVKPKGFCHNADPSLQHKHSPFGSV